MSNFLGSILRSQDKQIFMTMRSQAGQVQVYGKSKFLGIRFDMRKQEVKDTVTNLLSAINEKYGNYKQVSDLLANEARGTTPLTQKKAALAINMARSISLAKNLCTKGFILQNQILDYAKLFQAATRSNKNVDLEHVTRGNSDSVKKVLCEYFAQKMQPMLKEVCVKYGVGDSSSYAELFEKFKISDIIINKILSGDKWPSPSTLASEFKQGLGKQLKFYMQFSSNELKKLTDNMGELLQGDIYKGNAGYIINTSKGISGGSWDFTKNAERAFLLLKEKIAPSADSAASIKQLLVKFDPIDSLEMKGQISPELAKNLRTSCMAGSIDGFIQAEHYDQQNNTIAWKNDPDPTRQMAKALYATMGDKEIMSLMDNMDAPSHFSATHWEILFNSYNIDAAVAKFIASDKTESLDSFLKDSLKQQLDFLASFSLEELVEINKIAGMGTVFETTMSVIDEHNALLRPAKDLFWEISLALKDGKLDFAAASKTIIPFVPTQSEIVTVHREIVSPSRLRKSQASLSKHSLAHMDKQASELSGPSRPASTSSPSISPEVKQAPAKKKVVLSEIYKQRNSLLNSSLNIQPYSDTNLGEVSGWVSYVMNSSSPSQIVQNFQNLSREYQERCIINLAKLAERNNSGIATDANYYKAIMELFDAFKSNLKGHTISSYSVEFKKALGVLHARNMTIPLSAGNNTAPDAKAVLNVIKNYLEYTANDSLIKKVYTKSDNYGRGFFAEALKQYIGELWRSDIPKPQIINVLRGMLDSRPKDFPIQQGDYNAVLNTIITRVEQNVMGETSYVGTITNDVNIVGIETKPIKGAEQNSFILSPLQSLVSTAAGRKHILRLMGQVPGKNEYMINLNHNGIKYSVYVNTENSDFAERYKNSKNDVLINVLEDAIATFMHTYNIDGYKLGGVGNAATVCKLLGLREGQGLDETEMRINFTREYRGYAEKDGVVSLLNLGGRWVSLLGVNITAPNKASVSLGDPSSPQNPIMDTDDLKKLVYVQKGKPSPALWYSV